MAEELNTWKKQDAFPQGWGEADVKELIGGLTKYEWLLGKVAQGVLSGGLVRESQGATVQLIVELTEKLAERLANG